VSDKKSEGATVLAGGLVGQNDGTSATIEDSWAGGPVTINMDDPAGNANCDAGGFVGENNHGSIVLNSFATGSATANGECYALSGIGGLVGYNLEGTVDSASASGAATGGSYDSVGGLIGENDHDTVGPPCSPCGSVNNSVATGAASGGNTAYVGGLVGEVYNLIVVNGFSSGAVSGGVNSELGGFVGEDTSTANYFDNDGWNTSTSNISNCSQGAGNVPNDYGITGSGCPMKSAPPSGNRGR
jgi:hypothetical protein